jgi:hypothetical protein
LQLRTLIWLSFLFTLVGVSSAFSQNLSRVEYFFDTDLGYGNGISVPVSAQPDVSIDFQANISGLTEGFHNLFVRAFVTPYSVVTNGVTEHRGGWSLAQRRSFYKSSISLQSSTPPDIIRGEYFINTDLGFGNGINIPFTHSPELNNIAYSFNVGAFPNGFNTVFVRFKSSNGWGITQRRNFYKEDIQTGSGIPANIVAGECFFNRDPGFGAARPIAIIPGSNISNLSFVAAIDTLPEGFNNLFIRFKDQNGQWSQTITRTVYKENATTTAGVIPDVVGGEYFMNTDLGFGSGTPISLVPSADINNISFVAVLNDMPQGFNKLYVRFKNANGQWGQTLNRTFYKEDFNTLSGQLPNIVSAEYFVDTDPGFGKGKPISFNQGSDITNLSFAIDMTNVTIGNHQVYVRAVDANGKWSLTNLGPFVVEPPGELIITIGSYPTRVCAGSPFKVPFSLNTPFGSNNVFTLQLSNSSGSFASPTNIGSLTAPSGDTIFGTIPANAAIGSNYRIRIIASSPLDTSVAGAQAITIGRTPSTNFNLTGPTTTCAVSQGYAASNTESGVSYRWLLSGGGTIDSSGPNAIVTWTTAGLHSLSLISFNTCGDGITRTISVRVFDGAPAATPLISVSANGATLTATLADINAGATGYQWYFNNVLIPGATNRSFSPPVSQLGLYSVRFTNSCGEGSPSQAFNFTGIKQNQTITLSYPPGPVFGGSPFRILASSSSGLPVTLTRIFGPGNLFADDSIAITGAGTLRMRATQEGNASFNVASLDEDIVIAKAPATVTISNLS